MNYRLYGYALALLLFCSTSAFANRACCLPDGGCEEVAHQDDCAALNGEVQEESRTCEEASCGPVCGNGVVEDGEECDDGNDIDDDECSNNCKLNECPPGAGNLYRLLNHPDGHAAPPLYGLRIDELVDVTDGNDIFTFDFEHEDSEMWMELSGDTIHIYGQTYGGHVVDNAYGDYQGLFDVDFTYNVGVMQAPGDDDIVVDTDNFSNFGEIDAQFDDAPAYDLTDYRGSHPFSFRFGDEDDDNGHRGHAGLSGWGWVRDLDHRAVTRDWLFTAELVKECIPPLEELEGCKPRRWRHLDWVGYHPDDRFDDVFGVDAPGNRKLKRALKRKGKGVNGLMRHATAGLLNAAHPDVNYPLTEDEVIELVQTAFETGDYKSARKILRRANKGHCPLD